MFGKIVRYMEFIHNTDRYPENDAISYYYSKSKLIFEFPRRARGPAIFFIEIMNKINF